MSRSGLAASSEMLPRDELKGPFPTIEPLRMLAVLALSHQAGVLEQTPRHQDGGGLREVHLTEPAVSDRNKPRRSPEQRRLRLCNSATPLQLPCRAAASWPSAAVLSEVILVTCGLDYK